MSVISFAQNYEDVMLWRALRHVQHGFYVDVGANDPVIDSVTCWFYQQGWRGINIEPVPYWFDRLQNGRPRDINLRVAVSAESGHLTLYDVPDTGLSTLSAQVASAYQREGLPVVEITVPTEPLDSLLEQHAGNQVIHFLKIDVEGAEREVLQSAALTRFRPWIILVEATEPRDPTPNQHHWEELLTRRDYQFAYFDGLNRFYVAAEQTALLEALKTPPNTFDSFMRYSEWQLRNSVESLQSQVEQATYEKSLFNSEQRRDQLACDALRHDHQVLVQRHAELEQSQHQLKVEYQLLLQNHADLTQSLDARKTEIGLMDQKHAELQQRHDFLWGDLQRLNQEHAHLMQVHDQLMALQQRSGQEIAAHRQRIHDMLDSTSWRITGPLRRVGAWGKRLLSLEVPPGSSIQERQEEPLSLLVQASTPMPEETASLVLGSSVSPKQRATTDDLLLQHINLHWRLVDRLDEGLAESGETQCALCDFVGPTESFKTFETQCRFGGGRLRRIQCPQCDVIFGPKKMLRLKPEELSQEYDWHYRIYTEGDSTEQEIRAFEALAPEQGGTYLNYGAGAWSSSVRQLRERGWNVIAYEPTESAQNQPGLVTRRETLAGMRFHGIFSNNVLEHLRYPAQDMRFLASLLHPGGRMSHATPCFEYLYEYTRFHLFFYLGRSRQLLANRAGLRICSFQQEGHFMNAVYEPTGLAEE